MHLSEAQAKKHYEKNVEEGLALSKRKDLILWENNKGTQRLRMGDVMEGIDKFPILIQAQTAQLLHNTREYFDALEESTMATNIGSFEKFAFPMVRVVFPNLVSHRFSNLQTLQGPDGVVFFMQFLYNATKGSVTAGQDMIEGGNAFYASEIIDAERIGTAPGPNFTGNLDYTPVRPGSITMTVTHAGGTYTVTDNGLGALTGDVGAGSTISYADGAFDVTFTGVTVGHPMAKYQYNAELNEQRPEIDVVFTSAHVTAQESPLNAKWSHRAMFSAKSLHGIELETEILTGLTNEVRWSIDRRNIFEVYDFAAGALPAWSDLPDAGVSQTDHDRSFIKHVNASANVIGKATKIARGNVMIGGVNIHTLVSSIQGAWTNTLPEGKLPGRGVFEAGSFNGMPFILDYDFRGGDDGHMIGYKGSDDDFFAVGFIFAPWVLAYTSPTFLNPADMGFRKALSSLAATKRVNMNFFAKGVITHI